MGRCPAGIFRNREKITDIVSPADAGAIADCPCRPMTSPQATHQVAMVVGLGDADSPAQNRGEPRPDWRGITFWLFHRMAPLSPAAVTEMPSALRDVGLWKAVAVPRRLSGFSDCGAGVFARRPEDRFGGLLVPWLPMDASTGSLLEMRQAPGPQAPKAITATDSGKVVVRRHVHRVQEQ